MPEAMGRATLPPHTIAALVHASVEPVECSVVVCVKSSGLPR